MVSISSLPTGKIRATRGRTAVGTSPARAATSHSPPRCAEVLLRTCSMIKKIVGMTATANATLKYFMSEYVGMGLTNVRGADSRGSRRSRRSEANPHFSRNPPAAHAGKIRQAATFADQVTANVRILYQPQHGGLFRRSGPREESIHTTPVCSRRDRSARGRLPQTRCRPATSQLGLQATATVQMVGHRLPGHGKSRLLQRFRSCLRGIERA